MRYLALFIYVFLFTACITIGDNNNNNQVGDDNVNQHNNQGNNDPTAESKTSEFDYGGCMFRYLEWMKEDEGFSDTLSINAAIKLNTTVGLEIKKLRRFLGELEGSQNINIGGGFKKLYQEYRNRKVSVSRTFFQCYMTKREVICMAEKHYTEAQDAKTKQIWLDKILNSMELIQQCSDSEIVSLKKK